MNALPETLLPAARGRGWVGAGRARPGTVRAHVHDGRCVQCARRGPGPLAVDAESTAAPAAQELAARFDLGVEELLGRWTRAEVAAKLLARRSLVAFREGLEHDAALTIRTALVEDLVVSVGWLASPERHEAR